MEAGSVVSTTFEKEECELALVPEVGAMEDGVSSPPSISVPSAHSTPKEEDEGLPGSRVTAEVGGVLSKEGESGSGLEEGVNLISIGDAPE